MIFFWSFKCIEDLDLCPSLNTPSLCQKVHWARLINTRKSASTHLPRKGRNVATLYPLKPGCIGCISEKGFVFYTKISHNSLSGICYKCSSHCVAYIYQRKNDFDLERKRTWVPWHGCCEWSSNNAGFKKFWTSQVLFSS